MSPTPNQNPEQLARDKIDKMLEASGWVVQDKDKIDFSQGKGRAVREYPTDAGFPDYVLFTDRKLVGVVEAKRESMAEKITTIEEKKRGLRKSQVGMDSGKQNASFLSMKRPASSPGLRIIEIQNQHLG